MKKTVGYGWCGTWADDNSLGFLMSPHIGNGKRNAEPLSAEQRESLAATPNSRFASSDFYKVKVTIEIVKNKRGKPIVRRADSRGEK